MAVNPTNELPYIQDTETVENMNQHGSGADVILAIGKTNITKAPTLACEFGSYEEAVESNVIGTEGDSNELLAALKDIFTEGAIYNKLTDNFGIDKVYAINLGDSPTNDDWISANNTGRLLKDVKLEDYVGNSDIAMMGSVASSLQTLAGMGIRRHAVFTTAPDAVRDDILKMTDPKQTSYISNSRVAIKYLPATQHKFVAKVACTNYYDDPARGAYRSGIPYYNLGMDDLNLYTSAGIIVDWPHDSPLEPSSTTMEPAKCVSTAYRLNAGKRPADSNIHARRIADYIFRMQDLKFNAQLKINDTETNVQALQAVAKSVFEDELKAQHIKEYTLSMEQDLTDPYAVDVARGCTPTPALYKIIEKSTVRAPG